MVALTVQTTVDMPSAPAWVAGHGYNHSFQLRISPAVYRPAVFSDAESIDDNEKYISVKTNTEGIIEDIFFLYNCRMMIILAQTFFF
jgi:hypothetical protein